jgi:prepilin-type N-terminal cleavage/methylation domain-containing protein
MKNLIKQKRAAGFTIIEVMIVLAIAGLIMVIVFIAVPQLQRSERNTNRKSVVSRIKTEIDNYASNNAGAIPTADAAAATGFLSGGGFYTRYISNNASNFNDPKTGSIMTFSKWTSDGAVGAAGDAAVGTVWYIDGRKCNGEASQAGSGRNYVVMAELEGGAIFCLDNA